MKKEKCCLKGCNREIVNYKHKLCNTHYVRYQRTGSVGDAKIRKRRVLKPFSQK